MQPRPVFLVAALLAVAVGLSGCDADSPTGTAPSAETEADSGGTVGHSQSPDPSESATVAGTSSTDDHAFGPDGYYDLALGMSRDELAAMDHVVFNGGEGGPGLCAEYAIFGDQGDLVGYAYLTHERGVEQIVLDGTSRTPEGVGVGSTFAEVEDAYPTLTGVSVAPDDQPSEFLAPVPAHEQYQYWISFGVSPVRPTDAVSGLVLQSRDQSCTG